MTTTQMDMCLNEASIVVLKDNLTAYPQSNGFLNFGYQLPVDESTGEFILRSQSGRYLFPVTCKMGRNR